jgi:hypothetical protein
LGVANASSCKASVTASIITVPDGQRCAICLRCCRALLPCHLNGVSSGFTYRFDDLITLIVGCCGFLLVSYHTWLWVGRGRASVYRSVQSGVPLLRRIRSVIFVVCATTAFRGNLVRQQFLDSSRTGGTDANSCLVADSQGRAHLPGTPACRAAKIHS